ncbi:hypothetical protein KDU71_02485 [Carboxylicivirga sediminis]|uniref:Uncharacterized protein n=1 Tax=Carboxylicivirga sediminis TaxID=2006564 RepID=A0A941F0X4_9BACT|nr:hypothetical protein [Carboxylicivirga sediminis]MBR8534412.1 hypothetical protein [Carboxylicivirga sediminis]
MLSDFFRINLPYGLYKNKNGQWMAFNREYLPLGFNDSHTNLRDSLGVLDSQPFNQLPIHTAYKGLTEKIIENIAQVIDRKENGEIWRFFLYNDETNPMNNKPSKKRDNYFIEYFKKIERLSKLKIKNQI